MEQIIGIDLAKRVFQAHIAYLFGKVIKKSFSLHNNLLWRTRGLFCPTEPAKNSVLNWLSGNIELGEQGGCFTPL
ncbi:hypothetical protein ACP179_01150 (plasmid) [Xenorhabdus stockiae]